MRVSSQRFYVSSREAIGEPHPDQLTLFERAEREMDDWLAAQLKMSTVRHLNIAYIPVATSYDTIGFYFVHLVHESKETDSVGTCSRGVRSNGPRKPE